MATVLTRAPSAASVRGYEPPVVEIAVPVYNEVGALARSIVRLSAYLQHAFPFSVRVTIADNGSTDGTWEAALALAARCCRSSHRCSQVTATSQSARG